jgi:Helicase associated domain
MIVATNLFFESNLFGPSFGTKDRMQHGKFVRKYAVRQGEEVVSCTSERNPLRPGLKQWCDFDQEHLSELEPTPLGNHCIRVVDKLPLDEFKVSNGHLNDWIQLLRESEAKAEVRGMIPTTGVATADSYASKTVDNVDSIKVSKPSWVGSSASQSRRHLELPTRAHQNDKWSERFQELVEFHRTFGHSVVPYHYKKSAPLAWWVKRQRHQYKMKKDGNRSTLSDERERKLESLGFCWDSHTSIWEERLNELIEFRMQRGHTSISQSENPKLWIWVKCQRRQFKLFCAGQKSTMTQERINKLNAIDSFCWNPRRSSNATANEGAPF